MQQHSLGRIDGYSSEAKYKNLRVEFEDFLSIFSSLSDEQG